MPHWIDSTTQLWVPALNTVALIQSTLVACETHRKEWDMLAVTNESPITFNGVQCN